jgi:glutamate racemase
VTVFVAENERVFVDAGCDAWVIACNTASVVVAAAGVGGIPAIDMLAAIRTAAAAAPAGPVGVRGTAGTVRSGAVARVIEDREVDQLATEELLRPAEVGGADDPAFFPQARAGRSRSSRGAWMHVGVPRLHGLTCLLGPIRELAGDVVVLDPVHAAADLVLDRLSGEPGQHAAGRDRACLTGPHEVDLVSYAREVFGLRLPAVEYVRLDPVGALSAIAPSRTVGHDVSGSCRM